MKCAFKIFCFRGVWFNHSFSEHKYVNDGCSWRGIWYWSDKL